MTPTFQPTSISSLPPIPKSQIWNLDLANARSLQLYLDPDVIPLGLRELTAEGSFSRSKSEIKSNYIYPHEPESHALLASLSVVLEIQKQSGVFLIATGGAFNDLAASDFHSQLFLTSRSHNKLDFYILESDVDILMKTLKSLRIIPTQKIELAGEVEVVHKQKDYSPSESVIQLDFQSEKFLPSITFFIVRESPKGFILPEDLIYPENNLAYPKFYFNFYSNEDFKPLPLAHPKISSFILNTSIAPSFEQDMINVLTLMKGLPD